MTITFSPDKFGFYQAGDLTTYSKIEAIEYSLRTNRPVHWRFNEETFQQVDWTQEPPGTLWDLYKKRCEQIRNAYDYVILMFSGGSDSQNILDAWQDSGLHLDEVASLWSLQGSGDRQAFSEAEVANVVLPKMSSLPVRFRLIDQTTLIFDYLNHMRSDWQYSINRHLSPNNGARALLRTHIPEWADIIASGRRLCLIWGSEKPRIDDGALTFMDIVDNCISPHVQRKYQDGWYDELFYWTPDMPELLVKQAHTIKRFLSVPQELPGFYKPGKDYYGHNIQINKYLTAEGVKQLIYPTWNNDTFCVGKSSNNVFARRDEWFWTGNTSQSDLYREIVKSTFNIMLGESDLSLINAYQKKLMFSGKYQL